MYMYIKMTDFKFFVPIISKYNGRFVNIITKKELNEEMILSHLQNLRFNYLKKNIDLTCDYQDSLFIPNQYIESNIEKLSKLVKVNIFDGVNMNLSKKKIDFGARMFFALNSCPSKIVRLYSRVMYGKKSRIVLMASNIIKKVKYDLSIKAKKIFARIKAF